MILSLAKARQKRNRHFLIGLPLVFATLLELGISLLVLAGRDSGPHSLKLLYRPALNILAWIRGWQFRGWQLGYVLVRTAPVPNLAHRLNSSNLYCLFWWLLFAVSCWTTRSAQHLSQEVASDRSFARTHTWRHQKPGYTPATAQAANQDQLEAEPDLLLLSIFPREDRWSERPAGIITLAVVSVTVGVLAILAGQYMMLKLGWVH
jgi:hypothetical protein